MTQPVLTDDAVEATRSPHAIQVGAWQVVGGLNRLSRDSDVLTLEPKAMAVLLYLADRPGDVVSRDELLSYAWPGVVVGDNALTQVIAKLRKALGDTAHKPTYIEVISKKGYRLIAEVHRQGATYTPDHAVPRPLDRLEVPSVRRPGIVRSSAALAAAAVLGVVVLAAWMMATRALPGAPTVPAGSIRTTSAAIDATGLPTIIVQPFRALGDDPAQAALARALTADLVTDLSKVAGIRVVTGAEPANAPAGGSASAYRLSGTVQRERDHLRLNVLLTDAMSGQAVWSTRLDRQTRDLFAAQDDLAQSILKMLPVQLSEVESRRLARRQTRNVEAWETFVRAQGAMLVRRRAANQEARGLYWEAIRQDPAFARAYSGVAMTYALEYQLGWSNEPAAALTRAAELAQTSINMNPDMPEAHWVMAFVRTQRREHALALHDLDVALRLNPSYADAYALKGGIETYVGRPANAVPLLRQALRLNPDAGALYFLLLGRAYYFLADQEQAQVNLGEALARNVQSLEAHLYLAATKALAGDAVGAHWQADEVRALDPAFSARAWLKTYPLVDTGQRERLQAALEAIGLG